MYFAVIGDIMSNFSALTRILDALEEDGISRIVHTGNIHKDGGETAKCIRALQARRVLSVQGAMDKALLKGLRGRAVRDKGRRSAHAPSSLDSTSIEYLDGLRRKYVFTEEGVRIMICHGSVNSPNTVLDRHTPRAVFQRQRELEPADIIVSGGASAPFNCLVDNTLFVISGTMVAPHGAARYVLVDTEVLPPSAQTVTL